MNREQIIRKIQHAEDQLGRASFSRPEDAKAYAQLATAWAIVYASTPETRGPQAPSFPARDQ